MAILVFNDFHHFARNSTLSPTRQGKSAMKKFLLAATMTLIAAGVFGESQTATTLPTEQLPLNELRTFAQVFEQIREAYVEEIDDKTLLENAIIGMLAELDPHSSYLDQEDFEAIQEHASGEFGGLGIEISMENGLIRVIAPMDDTPAAAAGIKAGDLIIQLDDNLVQGMSLQEAIDLMRGPSGTHIELIVVREGVSEPLKFDITRDIIEIKSVRSRMLEPGYGYVRIAQFQENTGEQFAAILKKMKKDKPSLRGIVLDLRNNPGGVLGASVDTADALLDEGIIVTTKGRVASANSSFSAKPGDLLTDLPIVVIINGGSASAAEIVAGALQDNKRALIVGSESFGKGSVQSVLPISEGRAIKLTTARYFTPSGRSIQAAGITPDITLEEAEITFTEPYYVKEKQLPGHLSNQQSQQKKDRTSDNLDQDYQLFQALKLLKAAHIFGETGKHEDLQKVTDQ